MLGPNASVSDNQDFKIDVKLKQNLYLNQNIPREVELKENDKILKTEDIFKKAGNKLLRKL